MDDVDASCKLQEALAWLTGPGGAEQLERLSDRCDAEGRLPVGVQQKLRDQLSPLQWRLIATQLQLRRRATVKFTRAERMFFTTVGLEQASAEGIARYKAEHFPRGGRLADLCCGVGGDLLALADCGDVVGVDYDLETAAYAKANLAANGKRGEIVRDRAETFPVEKVDAWHIDPDRRGEGPRTTQAEHFSPDWSKLQTLLARNPHAAVKLAPATQLPEPLSAPHLLREWIGDHRHCFQQVAWTGRFAENAETGVRQATIIDLEDGSQRSTFSAAEVEPPPARERLGDFLFDPTATLLASGLLGAMATRLRLQPIAAGAAYLTGDEPNDEPLVRCFRVLHSAPLDRKHWRRELRNRDIGRLTIKKRGVAETPESLRRKLAPQGTQSGTLIVARRGKRVDGVLVEPVSARN